MQTWYSIENAVCSSVCHMCGLWQDGRNICPDFHTKVHLVFWEEECLVGGNPLYLKFWVNWPHWSEITNFEPIIARSASAVTPSDKSSINANRKSTIRFPMSLRSSWYVAPKPPKGWGAQKCKTAVFCLKLHWAWRKSATNFLCVKTQRQSFKAFIGLTIHAKMIGDPFCLKSWVIVTALEQNRRFSIYFCL